MHERELEREHREDLAKAEDHLAPGRASASASLARHAEAVPSGIIMRKGEGEAHADAEGLVSNASTSSGASLPGELQSRFESSLGTDLSGVRVHTGAESQAAAGAVNARAYAVGNDIHFGAGQYNPSSSDGQFLIAHEVAHTVQQRGSSATRQNKLVVSHGADAAEVEADRAASSMVSGAPASVGSARGGVIHRKSFGGFGGTAEGRAAAAGAAASVDVAPISISTEYSAKRAQHFSDKMTEFEKGEIPGYHDDKNNQGHALFPILVEIRTGYLGDAARVKQAESAYNAFVEPAALAEKAMAKFRAMQKQLGFNDEETPSDSLNDQQKKAITKSIDKEKMATLKSSVNAKQNLATGTRKEMLGTAQAAKAAALARVAELEKEKKDAADEDKAKIDEKIKAAKEAVETIIKVVEVVAGAVSGGATAGAMGTTSISGAKMGEELAKGSTGLVGMGVEAAMMRYYKEDLEKIRTRSRDAAQACAAASKLDTQFRGEAEAQRLDGQTQQLAGHMEEWTNAAKALHDYYVEVSEAAEKASGGKPGGAITQVMALSATASETRPHLGAGKSMAASASSSLDTQHAGMMGHRSKMYGTLKDASYGVTTYDGEGPDAAVVRACSDKCKSWAKQAEQDEMLLNRADVA
jgi:hypothetical protein